MFSFFKKKKAPEVEVRMPAREAARPKVVLSPASSAASAKAPEPAAPSTPAVVYTTAKVAAPSPAAPENAEAVVQVTPSLAIPAPADEDTEFSLLEFDRTVTRSSVMAINVSDHLDHLHADIEQVAVLFANGQTEAARGLLEAFLRAYPGAEGERLWQMYFGLLELAGDEAAHAELGQRYGVACGGRAPLWRQSPAWQAPTAVNVRGAILELSGDLADQKFDEIRPLLQNYSQMVLDFSKVRRIDFFSATQLASQLAGKRQAEQEVIIHAPNPLVAELMAMVGLNTLAEIFVPKE